MKSKRWGRQIQARWIRNRQKENKLHKGNRLSKAGKLTGW